MPPFLDRAFHVLQNLRKARGKVPADWPTFVATASAPLPSGIRTITIFSTQDEIVDWRACASRQGDTYQVQGRHLGLADLEIRAYPLPEIGPEDM